MLKAEDYKKYAHVNNQKRAVQIAKFYLSKWGKIERSFSKLNQVEKDMAKRLYATLKKITPEELEFLSNKYRVANSGKIGRTDKELAEMYGISLLEYTALRKGIECKFFYHLKHLLPNHVMNDKPIGLSEVEELLTEYYSGVLEDKAKDFDIMTNYRLTANDFRVYHNTIKDYLIDLKNKDDVKYRILEMFYSEGLTWPEITKKEKVSQDTYQDIIDSILAELKKALNL